MLNEDQPLQTFEAFSQFLFPLVLIVGALRCWKLAKSPNPREGRLMGWALGMFVAPIIPLGLVSIILSLCIRPSLWELAQTNYFYASLNWWVGFFMAFVSSSFYAASWALVFYSAFGSGSSSVPRFLAEQPQDAADR